jgi:hypothetical protein
MIDTMSNATLDKLIWTLLYGGLLTLCLGVFLGRPAPGLARTLMVGGALAGLIGVLLIWVRSRRQGQER